MAAGAIGALAAILVVVLARAPAASQLEAQSPLLGRPAPEIAGPALDGPAFSLAGLAGHFVVVDFLASWCPACRQEQPQLDRFVAEHASEPDGARLVGVVFDDSPAAVRSFLGGEWGRFPVLADPGGGIALDYGVRNPPEKYLIDPEGTVVAKIIGPTTAATLDRFVHQAEVSGR